VVDDFPAASISGGREEPRSLKRGRPAVLDEDRIVAAALRVVDREGFDRLTVRGLAADLGVAPASLYGHVLDKDALVDLVIDELLVGITVPQNGEPQLRVEAGATAIKQTLQARPGLSQAILRRGAAGPNGIALAEAMLSALHDTGVSEPQLWDAYHILLVYVHGTVLAATWPQSSRQRRRAHAARADLRAELQNETTGAWPMITAASRNWRDDPERRFIIGLRHLLAGFTPPHPDGNGPRRQ
jgi:AcrR family transcriptional regulator